MFWEECNDYYFELMFRFKCEKVRADYLYRFFKYFYFSK